MRRTTVAPSLLLCVLLVGCGSDRREAIEGTWRVVSGTLRTADTTISYTQENLFGMKMIVGGQWGIFGRGLSGGDTLAYYGGGTYTLEGKYYAETIKYNIRESRIGRTIPFEVEVRNDTLIQKGPPQADQYSASKWELHEVWVRVE